MDFLRRSSRKSAAVAVADRTKNELYREILIKYQLDNEAVVGAIRDIENFAPTSVHKSIICSGNNACKVLFSTILWAKLGNFKELYDFIILHYKNIDDLDEVKDIIENFFNCDRNEVRNRIKNSDSCRFSKKVHRKTHKKVHKKVNKMKSRTKRSKK